MCLGLKVHWWLNISRTEYGRAQHHASVWGLQLHCTDLLNHRGAFAVTFFHWRSSRRPSEDISVPLLHEHLSCHTAELLSTVPLLSSTFKELSVALRIHFSPLRICQSSTLVPCHSMCKTLMKQPSWAKTVAKHTHHLQKLWTCVF